MNGDEWHDLITPISTSNGPDRFGDKHCRLALDNTKKDTSTFPTAKESLGGLDTVKQLKEKLPENLASQEPPVRIKSGELTLLIYCMFSRDIQYHIQYDLYIYQQVIFKIGSYNF